MNSRLKEVQVIGMGQASLDHLGRIAKFPEEDEKIELADLHVQCGGPASTALVTLSRLGIATSFWGSVSDDHFGKEMHRGLIAEGVDATFLKVTPGYTSQYPQGLFQEHPTHMASFISLNIIRKRPESLYIRFKSFIF